MKQKYIINIFILLILIISSFLLLYKFNNQNIVGIDEFKYIDWSINIFSEKAVLNYFRPVFYIVSNISTNLFGFSFKANTNDTRESSAIKICKDLLEEGAILHIHDPKVNSKQIELDLKIKGSDIKYYGLSNDSYIKDENWFYSENIYDSAKGADAIVVLTEWEEYSIINWEEIARLMRKPSWIFDSRSILNDDDIKRFGLNFWKIGNGSNNASRNFN